MNVRTIRPLIAACVLAASTGFASADPVTFRISTENNANHVNTKFLKSFAEKVNAAAGDKIHVEVSDSGQLYKGRDVPRALRQGSVEMAAVGTWQLGSVAPDVDLLFIPSLYGRSSDAMNKLVDGEVGDSLDAEISGNLNSQVLGRWIGFGEALTFGAGRAVASFDDLKGMKVRIPGGLANTERYKGLGAVPTVVPWPDTQLALQQGTVDGLLTTYETAASGKLWESGVKTAFEDNQYFGYFVPIVSNAFWDKADPDVKKVLADTWDSMVDQGRADAALSQSEARKTLIDNGVKVTVPDPAKLSEIRAGMVANEAALVKELSASPELYEKIKATVD